MKRYLLISIIFFLLVPLALADTDDWHITKSTHFIVYYKNASKDFIEKLIEKSEDYYNTIAENLGFRRYNFWLWDDRAKIYVYDDAKDYQVTTGQPAWSMGSAIPKDKIIHLFPYTQGFFEIILPHELGHVIFRESVGFDNSAIPIWLDEGVASYQERFGRPIAKRLVKEAMDKHRFVSLEWLSNISPQLIKDPEIVNLFYAEAISVINYLISEFGKDKFVYFCQALRDKRNLEEAMRSTYHFGNIQELDRAWQRYLKNE